MATRLGTKVTNLRVSSAIYNLNLPSSYLVTIFLIQVAAFNSNFDSVTAFYSGTAMYLFHSLSLSTHQQNDVALLVQLYIAFLLKAPRDPESLETHKAFSPLSPTNSSEILFPNLALIYTVLD